MADVIKALGVSPTPPLVCFVWSDKIARNNKIPVDVLLAAAADANAVLAKSDAAWERLRPLVKPASDAELIAIRNYYRSGIPGSWGTAETASAKKLTDLLIELGDTELVGDGTRFDQNLFHTQAG
jgi:NitT/TauT family transport system substrate-binding protein